MYCLHSTYGRAVVNTVESCCIQIDRCTAEGRYYKPVKVRMKTQILFNIVYAEHDIFSTAFYLFFIYIRTHDTQTHDSISLVFLS